MVQALNDGLVFTQTITFETIVCCECHVPFAVSAKHRKELLDTHETFYCPAGHAQSYIGKSAAEKLREQLAAEKELRRKEEERLYNLYLDELNENKKLSRKLKRVHNGTCPCCKRSFQDLKRHMETKHPDILKQAKN